MSKLSFALLAVVAALALVVAGCGGGGDNDSISKAELIKQGDEVCKKAEQGLEGEAEEFAEENDIDPNKATEKQQEEVIEQVVAPSLHRQAEELRELGIPDGEEETVEAIYDSLESGTEELEEKPASLLEGKNPVAKASKLAREYGFKECGSEG